jgi:hypothetical protein
MQTQSGKKKGRPRKKESRAEFILLVVIIALLSVNIKILCDIYWVLTDKDDDFIMPPEPIGFYKCPKNKRNENLYCPIYQQEKH